MERLGCLDARGGFIRLEGRSLFLTSGPGRGSQRPGYWFEVREGAALPALVKAGLPAARDVALVGDHALICDYTKFLTVYEMSGGAWRQVARLPMPSMTENVIVRGDLAYVANHVVGLTIVDFSTPAKPFIVSNHDPQINCDALGLWRDIAILYGHHESRLVLVDVSDPANPRQTAVYQHDAGTFIQGEMAVHRGVAYCTGGRSGLIIVNVADPTDPRLVKLVDLKGVTDVVVEDGYAFIAAGGNGVRVLNVSEPADPSEVGHYRVAGELAAAQLAVHSVEASGGARAYRIYVANRLGPAMVLSFRAG